MRPIIFSFYHQSLPQLYQLSITNLLFLLAPKMILINLHYHRILKSPTPDKVDPFFGFLFFSICAYNFKQFKSHPLHIRNCFVLLGEDFILKHIQCLIQLYSLHSKGAYFIELYFSCFFHHNILKVFSSVVQAQHF